MVCLMCRRHLYRRPAGWVRHGRRFVGADDDDVTVVHDLLDRADRGRRGLSEEAVQLCGATQAWAADTTQAGRVDPTALVPAAGVRANGAASSERSTPDAIAMDSVHRCACHHRLIVHRETPPAWGCPHRTTELLLDGLPRPASLRRSSAARGQRGSPGVRRQRHQLRARVVRVGHRLPPGAQALSAHYGCKATEPLGGPRSGPVADQPAATPAIGRRSAWSTGARAVYQQETKNLLGAPRTWRSMTACHHEIPGSLPHPRSQQTT